MIVSNDLIIWHYHLIISDNQTNQTKVTESAHMTTTSIPSMVTIFSWEHHAVSSWKEDSRYHVCSSSTAWQVSRSLLYKTGCHNDAPSVTSSMNSLSSASFLDIDRALFFRARHLIDKLDAMVSIDLRILCDEFQPWCSDSRGWTCSDIWWHIRIETLC